MTQKLECEFVINNKTYSFDPYLTEDNDDYELAEMITYTGSSIQIPGCPDFSVSKEQLKSIYNKMLKSYGNVGLSFEDADNQLDSYAIGEINILDDSLTKFLRAAVDDGKENKSFYKESGYDISMDFITDILEAGGAEVSFIDDIGGY